MPYVIPKKLTLFTTARAGSHAISTAVLQLGAIQLGRHHGGYHNDSFDLTPYEHTLKFTNIRSHYDILARWHHHHSHARREINETFPQFIRWFHDHGPKDHNLAGQGTLFQHAPHCDAFVRAERMQDDWDAICRQLDLPITPLKILNVTPGLHEDTTRQKFTPEAIDTLRQLYGEEMRTFGYYDPPWENQT